MRILFYLHRFPAVGGIENVTAFLANAFIANGHLVEIISHIGVPGQEAAQILDSRILVAKMPESSCRSRNNCNFLKRHVVETKPDVIIFQDSYAPIECNVISLAGLAPIIVCEHNAPYQGYKERLSWGRTPRSILRKALEPFRSRLRDLRLIRRRKLLYSVCFRYILLSDRYFGEFKAMLGLCDSRKLFAIPNAVDTSRIKPAEKKKEVLFVGAVNYRKGVDMLIMVWECIACRFPDWQLVIVGDGPMRQFIEQRVAEMEIPNVRIEGYKMNPAEFFQTARIFAFPTRREGWPLVIQEAQANGCVPVIFDSFSAARDVVKDGETGILVPSFDLEEYICRLSSLMSSPKKIDEMSEKAILSVRDYSPIKILRIWDGLLNEFHGKGC